EIGIFTCDRPLVAFYERGGWTTLPGTALIGGTRANPLPSDLLGKVAIGGFFSEHARRHAADFAGARVELYPGEIDRLW
ncbi:MAG TPA: GNAT family N-acetyltransferase, partial [Patescibacteria group bacterium]|nr:GNAT family N-acetyltransferase [Patescibacteria group bacterium]